MERQPKHELLNNTSNGNEECHKGLDRSIAMFRSVRLETVAEPSLILHSGESLGKVVPDVNGSVEQVSRPNSGPSSWDATDLPSTGYFHDLAPIHRFFQKKNFRNIVAVLLQTFQILSLETEFRSLPKREAHCRSLEQCEWVVQFWNSSKEGMGLLEIHHVAGDSSSFREYGRLIMGALFDGNIPESLVSSHAMKPTSVVNDKLPCLECVNICLSLLLSDRGDSRMLGLEALSVLTDVTKTTEAMAKPIARATILGKMDSAHSTSVSDTRLQERILSLALADIPIEADETHKRQAHLALLIFANAVDLLDSKDVSGFVATFHFSTGVPLEHHLLTRIGQAESSPHFAYLAARILGVVCRKGEEVFPVVDEKVLMKAQMIGTCSHAALQKEVGELLNTMAFQHSLKVVSN